jgi:hypothetical protein
VIDDSTGGSIAACGNSLRVLMAYSLDRVGALRGRGA